MSTYGTFEIEDADIVRLDGRLDGDNDGRSRTGWVNVGAFALRIELGRDGDLTVQAYPCGNETQPLVSFTAMHADAMAAGATDNAVDDDGDGEDMDVTGEALDPSVIDDDTGEPVLRPRHVILGGNAYWLEPAFPRVPGPVIDSLMTAPLNAQTMAVLWDEGYEVEDGEFAEYTAVMFALQD